MSIEELELCLSGGNGQEMAEGQEAEGAVLSTVLAERQVLSKFLLSV